MQFKLDKKIFDFFLRKKFLSIRNENLRCARIRTFVRSVCSKSSKDLSVYF